MRIRNTTLIVENFSIRPANIEIIDNSIWLVAVPMNNRLDAYEFCEKYQESLSLMMMISYTYEIPVQSIQFAVEPKSTGNIVNIFAFLSPLINICDGIIHDKFRAHIETIEKTIKNFSSIPVNISGTVTDGVFIRSSTVNPTAIDALISVSISRRDDTNRKLNLTDIIRDSSFMDFLHQLFESIAMRIWLPLSVRYFVVHGVYVFNDSAGGIIIFALLNSRKIGKTTFYPKIKDDKLFWNVLFRSTRDILPSESEIEWDYFALTNYATDLLQIPKDISLSKNNADDEVISLTAEHVVFIDEKSEKSIKKNNPDAINAFDFDKVFRMYRFPFHFHKKYIRWFIISKSDRKKSQLKAESFLMVHRSFIWKFFKTYMKFLTLDFEIIPCTDSFTRDILFQYDDMKPKDRPKEIEKRCAMYIYFALVPLDKKQRGKSHKLSKGGISSLWLP